MSDLHLEFGTFHIPELPTDSESVLLLSGDIHVKSRATKKDWLKNLSLRFPYVLYVLGNHEHYKSSIDQTPIRIREELAKQNVTNVYVLDNESFEIPGTDIKIIGGTMWTDFNKGHPVTLWHAEQVMNDYKHIRFVNYQRRLKPRHLSVEFLKFKNYLHEELAKPFAGRIFIMTHHGPHQLSLDPMYGNDYHGNGCYASDLSDTILDYPQIKYWFHGHMHNSVRYNIGDDCEVINNPRGYYGHEMNEDFDPYFRITL
jgi:hypothetical protein